MKKKFFFYIYIALIGLGVGIEKDAAMDWPAEGLMTGNFGENDGGLPELGTVFAHEGSVRAADAGELLFMTFTGAGSSHASRLPSPMGAWIALDHRDGMVSIYSRLGEQALQRSAPMPNLIEKGAAIAGAGRTGRARREGFEFSLFDRRERRWVNPAMIIPPLPDTQPPVILSVVLKDADGRLVNLTQTRNISQGRYSLYVEVQDAVAQPGDRTLAPHRIVVSLNGREAGGLNFETFSVRDGILMAYRNSLVPARQVYAAFPAYEVGEVAFNRGQATLEIIALDVAGNSRNAVFRLTVE